MASERHVEIWEFTPRQRDIMSRLLLGLSPKETGLELGVEVRTVYWHIENIYRRLQVHSVGEFFAWALAHRECCGVREIWEIPQLNAG